MNRGFACVGLVNPKCAANVGGVMRAVGVYGAAMVAVSGRRFCSVKRSPTDTLKAWRHVPTLEADDVFDVMPHDCVPVAVEFLPERGRSLPEYRHPERAMYILGAEDATLGPAVLDRCRDVIYVPTAFCMNLAATVNVVLYDRMAKSRSGRVRRLREVS